MNASKPHLMKLAVSQELWTADEDLRVLGPLSALGCDGVVMSCRNLHSGLSTLTSMSGLSDIYRDFGMIPIGLKGVIPGSTAGRIFGNKEQQRVLLEELKVAADIAQHIEVDAITFEGAWLRNGATVKDEEDTARAVEFFSHLSEIGASRNVRFLIESCPDAYGCDFGRTLSEVAMVACRASDTRGLGIQLNTGAILLSEHQPRLAVAYHGSSAAFVDVCDPFYRPIGIDHLEGHLEIAHSVKKLRGCRHGPKWALTSGKRHRDVSFEEQIGLLAATTRRVRRLYCEDH